MEVLINCEYVNKTCFLFIEEKKFYDEVIANNSPFNNSIVRFLIVCGLGIGALEFFLFIRM